MLAPAREQSLSIRMRNFLRHLSPNAVSNNHVAYVFGKNFYKRFPQFLGTNIIGAVISRIPGSVRVFFLTVYPRAWMTTNFDVESYGTQTEQVRMSAVRRFFDLTKQDPHGWDVGINILSP